MHHRPSGLLLPNQSPLFLILIRKQWYEPYDQRKWKGEWGEAFLEHQYQTRGMYDEDDEVREKPWTVWDRSERGVHND
jgi:hypothetical protein